MKGSKLKKRVLKLEIVYDSNADLYDILRRILLRSLPIGDIHINVEDSTCIGTNLFHLPFQEPTEKIIDGQWVEIYKSNFK